MATVSETIPGLARERALALYREMVVIRRTEEALARAHAAGLVHGACHTYVGEEAVAVGVSAHLRSDDTVLSTHRGHGHALAKGVAPAPSWPSSSGVSPGARAGGVAACICSPRGRPPRYERDRRAQHRHGDRSRIQLPPPRERPRERRVLRRRGAVQRAFIATEPGGHLEPVLFVCEPWQPRCPSRPWRATRTSRRGASPMACRASGSTGNVLAVHEAAGEAVRRARRGDGPTLLECLTYRTRAHSEGMRDAGYRTRDEVEALESALSDARAGGIGSSRREGSRPRTSTASIRRWRRWSRKPPSLPRRARGRTPRPPRGTCTRSRGDR